MAYINDGRALGFQAIEKRTLGARVVTVPRGQGFKMSATTGLIAAAQAAGSCFFAMRLSPNAGAILAFIEKIRVQYTTIGAFTTPVTAGRRLSWYRGAAATASGGTALLPFQSDSTLNISQVHSSNGGDARIATTAALTQSITWEAQPFRECALSHVGTAGGNVEDVYPIVDTSPVILQPGQVIGLRAPQAFDAAGTWQASLDIDWHESVGYLASSAAD